MHEEAVHRNRHIVKAGSTCSATARRHCGVGVDRCQVDKPKTHQRNSERAMRMSLKVDVVQIL